MSSKGEVPAESAKRPINGEQLTPDEEFIITSMLLLAGREDKLKRNPLVADTELSGIQTIVSILRDSTERGTDNTGKCNALNRLLVPLGLKPVTREFFDVVFGNVNFAKGDQVQDCVNKFRCLSMLEYGSFRHSYDILRHGRDVRTSKSLKHLWSEHFPTADEVNEREEKYKTRAGPVGLIEIPPNHLFCLGYPARQQTEKINNARQRLIALLEDAMRSTIGSVSELIAMGKKHSIENLGAFIVTAGIPCTEKVLHPNLWAPNTPYQCILKEIREDCVIVDEDSITEAQSHGNQNVMTYLAMQDINIYLAMRNPLNFISNQAFVSGLFKQGKLSSWVLRFFDPTQCFSTSRIQEGLTECLMMRRADVTIYSAQESGTTYNIREFGRDAEVAVALTQGKPVIVFVPRLFPRDPKFVDLYRLIDDVTKHEVFVSEVKKSGYLTESQATLLLEQVKTKTDSLALLAETFETNLTEMNPLEIQAELIGNGYDPPLNRTQLIEFTVQRIVQLEKRALNFRDVNPLSLRASSRDGIARGVIVTRSIEDTAEVLRGLLLGTLGYEIVDQDENWILVDMITKSPIRIITKSSVLTTAFSSEFPLETP